MYDDLRVLLWPEINGFLSKKRVVEIISLNELEQMYDSGILGLDDDDEDNNNNDDIPPSKTNHSSLEKGTSNNDGLNVSIENSQNDRVIVAEDPLSSQFRLTVDFSKDDSHPIDCFEEVDESESETEETTAEYIANKRETMAEQRRNEGFTPSTIFPTPADLYNGLLSDYRCFNNRLQDGVMRVYDFCEKLKPHGFFSNVDQWKKWKNVPTCIFKYDAYYIRQFVELNDVSKQMKSLQISINFIDREFAAFHYTDPLNSLYARNPNEYVEVGETMLLYRFEIKAAVCKELAYPLKSGRLKRRYRFYVSFCRLDCNSNWQFQKHRFILLSILTTLCATPYTIYLVWDNSRQCVVEWKNEYFIKYFWCDFNDLILQDHCDYLKEQRDKFFRTNLYVYQKDALIARDYQKIGYI
jgi:hypothetical protein